MTSEGIIGRGAAYLKIIGMASTAALIGIALARPVQAGDGPQVVVSIKPVHSLVAAVMEGAGEPVLLVSGGASPHTYSLRPSEARALQQAKIVFWVGEGMETFLQKPLSGLPADTRIVTLADVPGMTLLANRDDSAGASHAADHDHDESHAAHHAEPDAEHHHDDPHDHAHGENSPHGHHHAGGDRDLHLWLDADNARTIVATAARVLSAADPERAERYQRNQSATEARIAALDAELRAELAPVADRPYVVFHDAYHYLEHRYGMRPVGAITISPDRSPSAQRVAMIRSRIVRDGVVCVFSEPQFKPALVNTLIEGTSARSGVLDPDGGVGVPAGPDAYFTVMRNLGLAFSGCLSSAS